MRYLFGGTADYVILAGPDVEVGDITGKQTVLYPGAPVTFWDSETGGAQYLNLLDLTDTEIPDGIVTADSNGALPRFQGPENVGLLYVDSGGGRRAMVPINLGADVASLLARVAALEATVAGQQSLLAYALFGIKYDSGSGAYPAIPAELAGVQYLIFIGPPVPASARVKDLHIDSVE